VPGEVDFGGVVLPGFWKRKKPWMRGKERGRPDWIRHFLPRRGRLFLGKESLAREGGEGVVFSIKRILGGGPLKREKNHFIAGGDAPFAERIVIEERKEVT